MTRDDIIDAMAYAMHHSDLAPSRAVFACNLVPPSWERSSSRDVWRHMLNASPLKPEVTG